MIDFMNLKWENCRKGGIWMEENTGACVFWDGKLMVLVIIA